MIPFATLKIPGSAALDTLESCRLTFPQTGEYPFLIGDADELARMRESAEFNKQESEELIRESSNLDLLNWLRERREEAEEYDFSESDTLGDWPGELSEQVQFPFILIY